MRKCVAAMLTGVLVLGLAVAGESAGAGPPKIKIGHDTTRITAPLKPDGMPDYIAALNKQYSRGVTPENNAVVLILQAVGPENVIDEKIRAAMLKAIGYRPPAAPAYFADYRGTDYSDYEDAREGSWRRGDHPTVARWLDANKAPLELLVAASKRSRHYMPIIAASEDEVLLDTILLSNLSRYSFAAKGLIARANLAIAEGRIGQAWQDILAVHRLGVLMGQDCTLVGHLIGASFGRRAGSATIRLATSGKLTAAQAKAILADMKALGPPPDIVTTIDQLERYSLLNLLVWFQKDYGRASKAVGMTSTQAERDEMKVLFSKADFNDILRRANVYFDTLAAAMRKDSFAERNKAYANIDERIHRLIVEARILAEKKKLLRVQEPLTTHETGSMLLGIMLPTLRRAKEIADARSVRRDLATVAVALAAHRAQNGSYPGQLSALAPKYLKAVPEDLCGGKPFIYRRVGQGYLLYSVGENMRDDGGAEAKPDKDDIAVQAER